MRNVLYQFQIKALSSLTRLRRLNILSVRFRHFSPRRLDFILDLKSVCVGVIALVLGAMGGVVFATSDKALLYGGAGQGRVIFDGRLHASKGLVCKDCHSDIFDTKKKALMTMDDHFKAVACFTCHDGTKVFNDCEKCHRKF